ncbi:hypothetical protein pb186bvf_009470 [Paramecium bursaria]
MNKKIPGLFEVEGSAKKRIKSPQKRLHSPRSIFSPLESETTNIKVFARFRPPSKHEVELMKNGVGCECCLFPDPYTVCLQPDNCIHTFDRTFNISDSQLTVYECVGRDSIQDVLNGYNGTIFAYGQTGSGKTYTMFGEIRDELHKGIIPRSIESIFQYINSSEPDSEFVLTCSMLEIYKETLYDLLSVNRPDLKIKESATRGIYVENLTQLSLQSESELLRIVELGEQTRKVAATRINQYSSRSHTIFMLEIKQKFSNDTEKKGKLNLVDLAGSEKVGKTGAMGEILEEAKKINLSLSCLGNVIHALTTNNEHIPYRNSKLTRILQESLGGNFKTSLIVTCSSHSSSLEETVSTLKFASRAKSIKNHFKMNVKMSSEMMQQMIRDLKLQLFQTQQELDCVKKRSIMDIPNEDTTKSKPYDSKLLSNQEKSCFKPKHQSYQSTPSLTDIQKNQTIDLSFFSSKKTSQPDVTDQLNQMRENELNLLKQIDDLRQQLGQVKLESQRKQSKIQQLNAKMQSLENIINKQQLLIQDPKSSVNPLQVEFNQILLDENTYLNQQLHLIHTDQEDYFNNMLKERLEILNIEYFRKVDSILNGEINPSKITKIINKSLSIDQVVQKLSFHNFLSSVHKIISQQIQSKFPQDQFKRINDFIEESLKSPQIEKGLMDLLNQYEQMKQSRSDEQKIEALKVENSRLNQTLSCLNEQIQQLCSKNKTLTDALKEQNLNVKLRINQLQSIWLRLQDSQQPLLSIENKRPISQCSDRTPTSTHSSNKPTARKPSTFFRYDEL